MKIYGKSLAIVALAASLGTAHAAGNPLTNVPGSMVSGLADAVTISRNATTGVLSVIGSGITGISASNITTGTLPSAQLPVATSSAVGAVSLGTTVSNGFVTGFNSAGAAQYAQPTFAGIAGTLAGAQIPPATLFDGTCDGSTTAYTLAAAPTAAVKVDLRVGGVSQQAGGSTPAFTVSGTTLTLGTACPNTVSIEARIAP